MGDKFDLIKKPPEHQSFYLIPYSSKLAPILALILD